VRTFGGGVCGVSVAGRYASAFGVAPVLQQLHPTTVNVIPTPTATATATATAAPSGSSRPTVQSQSQSQSQSPGRDCIISSLQVSQPRLPPPPANQLAMDQLRRSMSNHTHDGVDVNDGDCAMGKHHENGDDDEDGEDGFVYWS
jgi:hypothetical protein